jgi:hypothetical protein
VDVVASKAVRDRGDANALRYGQLGL